MTVCNGQEAGQIIRLGLNNDDIVQLKQEEMFDMEDDGILSIQFFSINKLLAQFLDVEEEDPNNISHY